MSVTVKKAKAYLEAAKGEHEGLFITGPDVLEVLKDKLPDDAFQGEDFILTASLGNCRCTSDIKAVKQFTGHSRIPNNADKVVLGHETLQLVLAAPEGTGIESGDLVLITPGHSAIPVDPESFLPSRDGVLAALGYSYRFLGGLRQFNALPVRAIEEVRKQGFGALFNKVKNTKGVSLVSMAHAEPFACNYGTNKYIFTLDEKGDFIYNIPSKGSIAYLGGGARMGMINLTIVSNMPKEDLPTVVYLTDAKAKLDELDQSALVKKLRDDGVTVQMVPLEEGDSITKLQQHGKPNIVFTNFPAQSVYEQAVAIIDKGGNINNYAGASNPEVGYNIQMSKAPEYASFSEEAKAQILALNHNEGLVNPLRYKGLAKEGTAALIGFEAGERLNAYLATMPEGHTVFVEGFSASELRDKFGDLNFVDEVEEIDDLLIASTGEKLTGDYAKWEPKLARNSAVNCVSGDGKIFVNSRFIHYKTRHQLCGPTTPFYFTNTSEPLSEDLAKQAEAPINFDWLVKGIAGLKATPEMLSDVTANNRFGTFFTFMELPELPYVQVDSAEMKKKADELEASAPTTAKALRGAADAVARNDEVWCREAEEAMYAAWGVDHPLA